MIYSRIRVNLIGLRLPFRPEVACSTAVVSIPITRLQDSVWYVWKPRGHALMWIYFVAHEKDLVYDKIRTTVWQDETLPSKRSSTELASPAILQFVLIQLLQVFIHFFILPLLACFWLRKSEHDDGSCEMINVFVILLRKVTAFPFILCSWF